MAAKQSQRVHPAGGLRTSTRTMHDWEWSRRGEFVAAPVRCKPEQWYVVRGRLRSSDGPSRLRVVFSFIAKDEIIDDQCVTLHGLASDGLPGELLGWFQAPPKTTHFQTRLTDERSAGALSEMTLHPVAERDPKCHPVANTPLWTTYAPPFELERILLPQRLEGLVRRLGDASVEILPQPASVGALAQAARGAACVLDDAWVRELNMTLADVERVAADSWLIVGLDTMVRLLNASGRVRTRIDVHESRHEIMSARVEYADVATRGFAQQDVFPFGVVTEDGGFRCRVLAANKAWKRYADETGFATLLASETPFEKHCGDVLLAAQPTGAGELIVTDVPWLAAGDFGPLLAPRLMQHVLRMLLGRPLDEPVEYWNRWEDTGVLLRDVADMARRFDGLSAVRWASTDPALAHLGLSLAQPGVEPKRHLVLCTGRVDQAGVHDGLPPEPMMIFMKWLASEIREQTPWARRRLAEMRVTWQFDSAAGLRNVVEYDSAALVSGGEPDVFVRVFTALGGADQSDPSRAPGVSYAELLPIDDDPGVYGDGSLAYQANLTAQLKDVIEDAAAAR